jgi:hypothetical protein
LLLPAYEGPAHEARAFGSPGAGLHAGVGRGLYGPAEIEGFTARQETIMTTTHKELTWERNFDTALERGGGKHLLVDFSAAPM